jgi:hypothetical protein
MKVRRIVANVAAPDPARAEEFYGDILGVRRFFVRDPFGRLVNVLSHVEEPRQP